MNVVGGLQVQVFLGLEFRGISEISAQLRRLQYRQL